ncbi:hypothetical protein, partial [Salmonella enterica]|uniref:hypothetical protein n=1 Tax=Salmonella enterica TaxID=28901 RepID=UPI00325BB245
SHPHWTGIRQEKKRQTKPEAKHFFFKFITIPCLGNNAKRNVFKTNLKKSKLSFLVVDCFFLD